MPGKASLQKYRPCVLTIYNHDFPALCCDYKALDTIAEPAIHAFMPRLALTEEDLDLLETNGVFSETSGFGVRRESFMGLQMIFPKKLDPSKAERWRIKSLREINRGICSAVRLLARRSEEASVLQKGLIQPLYVTRAFFREIIENFDMLQLKIEIHENVAMYFALNGHILCIVEANFWAFPDTQVTEIHPITPETFNISDYVNMTRQTQETKLKGIALAEPFTDSWVITDTYKVEPYWRTLGLKVN